MRQLLSQADTADRRRRTTLNMGVKNIQEKAIGREMAQYIPQDGKPWFKKPHLLRLNFYLFSLFLFSAANGYDGSMMNGLQALPQWHDFMNNPT